MEIRQLNETDEKWILFTDGASNIRGSGLGIILKSPQWDIIPQSISCGFQATNNEAEYESLITGLQLDKDMKIRNLKVRVDSLLITNHFNGSYAVKGEILAIYLQIVKELAKEFKILNIEHVPRENNAEADALANLGSTLKILAYSKIPIIHILHLTIDLVCPEVKEGPLESLKFKILPEKKDPGSYRSRHICKMEKS
ncbi:uncharacterized protein LOC143549986 [Bidens hawaiensis]|uniref:uncharacterized protein LOC143549986 n=1 Tax=Bidens hawaiensis TaxID=980011 RepID=UPI0040499FBC